MDNNLTKDKSAHVVELPCSKWLRLAPPFVLLGRGLFPARFQCLPLIANHVFVSSVSVAHFVQMDWTWGDIRHPTQWKTNETNFQQKTDKSESIHTSARDMKPKPCSQHRCLHPEFACQALAAQNLPTLTLPQTSLRC